MTTVFTYDTTDTEGDFASWKFNRPVVVTVNRKTSRVSARACKLVELKVRN